MEPVSERRPIRAIDTLVGQFELLEGGIIFWTIARDAVIDRRLARVASEAAATLRRARWRRRWWTHVPWDSPTGKRGISPHE